MPFGVISEKEAHDHALNTAGYATPEQIDALREWAAKHGRTWKAKLRDAWMDGDYGLFEKSNHLQRLRNTLGPRWLNRVVLPQAGGFIVLNSGQAPNFADKVL
jgi:hypothetical protein